MAIIQTTAGEARRRRTARGIRSVSTLYWCVAAHGGNVLARAARVSKRVLVIDDLSYMRDIQVILLKEAGYTATALAGAGEALDRLTDLAPDLILLDLSMPGMDGRQFLRRLRAVPQWKNLPVILTTGRTAEEVRGECDCEVLCKPFSDAALLERVRRLIGDATECRAN